MTKTDPAPMAPPLRAEEEEEEEEDEPVPEPPSPTQEGINVQILAQDVQAGLRVCIPRCH